MIGTKTMALCYTVAMYSTSAFCQSKDKTATAIDLNVAVPQEQQEQVVVRGKRRHYLPAPLPGAIERDRSQSGTYDVDSGATITEFGGAYSATAPVPAINPAGNWPPPHA